MNILEAIKKPFLKGVEPAELSNTTSTIRTVKELSDSDFDGVMVFSDINNTEWINSENQTLLTYQNKVIDMYRQLAKNPDVDNIIDMLVNEMVFTVDKEELKINIDDENNTIKDAISDVFSDVLKTFNTTENLHSMCRQLYIDGQLNISLGFDQKDLNAGVKQIKIVESKNLYFHKSDKLWKYDNQNETETLYSNFDPNEWDEEYSVDELVHVDFGLVQTISIGTGNKGKINLGYLENAFKAANQLNTLENMLVPLRYSRSVSRRLFNIDVAELPPKKAKELMDKIRSEFRYKKTYDTENGTIKNQQSSQPLVEDYWLSNRNGGRGTTVDTMDEKGGLMDLEDILYSTKKLYTSLKVPSSRNPYDDNPGDFSFDTQDVTNEELQFYLHVDRLRLPIVKLFGEVLKRQLIVTGVMNEAEYIKFKDKINIEFTSKSIFLENMEKDLFIKSLGNWQDIKEEVGVIVSFESAIEKTFGWSNDQLKTEMEKIKEETNNPLYKAFYSSKEDSF